MSVPVGRDCNYLRSGTGTSSERSEVLKWLAARQPLDLSEECL